jgi:hypothetical protein
MNLFPPLLVLADKMVLVGGQAPLAWQRAIATREVWLKEWREAATWVEVWSSRQPTLREGSLFGLSLSLLTGEGDAARTAELPAEAAGSRSIRSKWPGEGDAARAAELPAEATGPRSIRSKWPGFQPGHDKDLAPTGSQIANLSPPGLKKWARTTGQDQLVRARGEPPAGHPRPLLGNFAPQASRALLNGLAGTAVPAGGSSQPQGRRLLQPQTGRAKVKAPVPADPAAGKHWLRTVAKRSAGVFRSNSAPISAQEPAPHSSRSSLPEPWATAVTGAPAPQAVLARLAGVIMAEGRRAAAESSSGFATDPEGTSNAAGREAPSPWPSGDSSLKKQPQSAAERQQSDHPGRAQSAVGEQMASPLGANLHTNGGFGRQSEHAPVLPPSAVPALPTLRPSMFNREATVPVASAMIRREAQQEKERGGEDDLVELSTKIKRILDEEARRYGIDV